jgi:hypothetical protein
VFPNSRSSACRCRTWRRSSTRSGAGSPTAGTIAADDRIDGVCPCTFAIRPVHDSWRATSLFAVSDTINGYLRPTYHQIIWPDRQGGLPWEPGFETRFEGLQPLLWLPRDDHPPGAWTRIDDPPA